MPLYISYIDLTKAFDLVSRDGLLKILTKIGLQTKNMWGTVQHDENVSKHFKILNSVKQDYVLAPTLLSLLLKQTFGTVKESTYTN